MSFYAAMLVVLVVTAGGVAVCLAAAWALAGARWSEPSRNCPICRKSLSPDASCPHCGWQPQKRHANLR